MQENTASYFSKTLAHEALTVEDKVGTMLPCNVAVHETADRKIKIEVAAIDPVASMMAIENPGSKAIAQEVRGRLRRVIADV
jgi:uncharacterized protein (DUF302 family)